MRPVKLEMEGFAGFRDRTVVDFTDADYFALVGPTGSGKSTVLDALTFALYGTAPRWGRTNAISFALAPTSNRCTVSLVFDVGNERFQVAREVRRSGKSIQQKGASLVQYADRSLVEIGPEDLQPIVLCGEVNELTPKITELLGLEFDDFCQCVVLPQGEFAKFLSAKPGERQDILLKLLGATHYDTMRSRASGRATDAAKEVAVLTEQLGTHADANPEAEAAARAEAVRLDALRAEVEPLVAGIDAYNRATEAADIDIVTRRMHLDVLTGLAIPDGIVELQQQAAEASEVLDAARKDVARLTKALSDATAAVRNGPQRGSLEQARERYVEQSRLIDSTGVVTVAAAQAAKAANIAVAAGVGADAAVEATRTSAEDAKARALAATTEQQQLAGVLEQVGKVRSPDGLADVADRAREALEIQTAALVAAAAGRALRDQMVAVVDGLPGQDWSARARAELDQLVAVHTDLAAARQAVDDATATLESATAVVTDAKARVETAEQEIEAERTAAAAAVLRKELQEGRACPVCEQTVNTLPPAHETVVGAAAAAGAAARAALDQATTAEQAAQRGLHDAQSAVTVLRDRSGQAEVRLAALLADRPAGVDRDLVADRVFVEEVEARRAAALTDATEQQAAVAASEAAVEEATARLSALQADLARFRADLHISLGALAALDPPNPDAADLSRAWAELERWASGRVAELTKRHQEATVVADEAGATALAAAHTLAQAILVQKQAATARTETGRASDGAARDLKTLQDRLAELRALLATARAAAEIPALLAECDRLDANAQAIGGQVEAANARADEAEKAQQAWAAKVAVARTAVNAARDTVAALTPPVLSDTDLQAAWSELVAWAASAVTVQNNGLAASTSAAAESRAAVDTATVQVQKLLSDNEVDHDAEPGASPVAQASRLVAVAAERARSRADSIATSLGQRASLQVKIADAFERQQVAEQLAALLRSNKFPEWLASSVLDVLVVGASETLRRLSGNQYDLTHDDKGFFVIDHADADSKRSVRTLSGGETFQASLSLALALAEQLRGLGGAAKLESIFLDEGFGTLDPDALEVVAGTLENLAHGERMVGVITHVAALAERAPVRYRVRNDSRTSTITRED